MNSEFIFQIKKIDDELHTILTLKDLNVSIETFFNELQKVKHKINSKITIDFATRAGEDYFFNKKGILKDGIGYEVKVDYSWHNSNDVLCKNFMLF